MFFPHSPPLPLTSDRFRPPLLQVGEKAGVDLADGAAKAPDPRSRPSGGPTPVPTGADGKPICGSCYEAKPDGCCNTCADVLNAFYAMGSFAVNRRVSGQARRRSVVAGQHCRRIALKQDSTAETRCLRTIDRHARRNMRRDRCGREWAFRSRFLRLRSFPLAAVRAVHRSGL